MPHGNGVVRHTSESVAAMHLEQLEEDGKLADWNQQSQEGKLAVAFCKRSVAAKGPAYFIAD